MDKKNINNLSMFEEKIAPKKTQQVNSNAAKSNQQNKPEKNQNSNQIVKNPVQKATSFAEYEARKASEIKKNPTSSFAQYPVFTTHSETGIMVHPNGRSEGCFMFDTTKAEGAEAWRDIKNRTIQQGQVLRGRVTCVTDKRRASERRAAPVYYLNNPNYNVINTGE